MNEHFLDEASEAEATLATAQVWAVASGVAAPKARLDFTFWVQNGAMTLTGYEAMNRGVQAVPTPGAMRSQHDLRTIFGDFARRHTGMVRMRLEKESSGWSIDYEADFMTQQPPEAKTLPSRRTGTPSDVVIAVTDGVSKLLGRLEVPTEGQVRVEVKVDLEDSRTVAWDLVSSEVTRRGPGGPTRKLSQQVLGEVVQVLLPFTQGIGPRSVQLVLRGELTRSKAAADGWVETARVMRPSAPPGLDENFVAEYRRMHESILWHWREGVIEGAEWLARRGTEELALWYVGGIATKGAGLLVERAIPTVLRAIGRGGHAGAGWLRTILTRLPGDEKRAFERLWAKVQLEGKAALSKAEHTQLQQLMERLELLARTELDDAAKTKLRAAARETYKGLHPELAKLLDEMGAKFPIHHRRPLEYAQLFADENINAAENLAMVRDVVHKRLNAMWTRFRKIRPNPTAEEVRQAADVIDGQFAPWYHQAGEPIGASQTLQGAEEAVLSELARLFPS